MSPTRALRTSTFRLALAYLGLFSLSALALFWFVYQSSVTFMDRQTKETIDAEIAGLVEQYRLREIGGLRSMINQRAQTGDSASLYLLLDRGGRTMAGNLGARPTAEPDQAGYIKFTIKRPWRDGEAQERQALARQFTFEKNYVLIVGRDIEDRLAIQRTLRNAIVLGSGLMIILGVLGGVVLARWMLARLENVNRTTEQIMRGDLSRRIELQGTGDEFDELAHNLNIMLERIERLLAGMRQVTDNIAHDLRTPLTRMRSRIEVALLGDPSSDESRELLEATIRDADSLINTFNALLNIAKAESGDHAGEQEEVDLGDLARDVAELYEPFAEERNIRLILDGRGKARTMGNPHLVFQALANLVDNAIKYSPDDGTGQVVVEVRAQPVPRVVVADNGPGIPAEMREKALQRFVRLDADRSTPGNGLGLSLVSAVARLHEASLTLADNHPGLRVELGFKPLPAAKPADTLTMLPVEPS